VTLSEETTTWLMPKRAALLDTYICRISAVSATTPRAGTPTRRMATMRLRASRRR
jgi:hypothetical protein